MIPKLVDQLVDLAMLARQSGLLALEEKAEEIKDPFFKQSVLKIVDANDPDKVREMLEKELDDMAARHDEGAGIYEKGSAYAPAFGMIGTLVGLVNMLKNMNVDEGGASSLGADMSVALVTTFYGCILANLIFGPIAKKLRIRNDEEMQYRMIMMEGIISIQAGAIPSSFVRSFSPIWIRRPRPSSATVPEKAAEMTAAERKRRKRSRKNKDSEGPDLRVWARNKVRIWQESKKRRRKAQAGWTLTATW